jgi:hypothetical protein
MRIPEALMCVGDNGPADPTANRDENAWWDGDVGIVSWVLRYNSWEERESAFEFEGGEDKGWLDARASKDCDP